MKNKEEDNNSLDQTEELFVQEVTSFTELKNEPKSLEENQENEEKSLGIEEIKNNICKKRISEDKESSFVEKIEGKRPKKDDKEKELLEINQSPDYQSQSMFKPFKTFSESSVSPFSSLKSNNPMFVNSSGQSAKKAFGSNISGPNFESLVSSSEKDTKESVSEEEIANSLTDTYKKASDKAFGILLEQQLSYHDSFDDNMTKVTTFVLEQEVKTGEEHEKTIYSTRARLYVVDSVTKDWKERGIGTLRVNIDETQGIIKRSRLVMRADAVYKVILNASLFKEMLIEGGNIDDSDECNLDKFLKIVALEDGKPTQFAIKVKDNTIAQQLRQHILSALPDKKIQL
ncbi:hypothetical protein T552_01941 [Pneumocystis carinii B80]|uniref:RanBD1 domain-containing protein n=1 Tax=Pneumocystis carinii (strain B80) TaxID=1408658 RepID=A0A0W4ZI63_PNEC8|nr:hypothetical protein T552_01941 [Pneumocystis carinii B80]KTW28080.1 hypothetical protein T552_01941 [Pneumocystis carinii B80]